jgi:hypothetical protein
MSVSPSIPPGRTRLVGIIRMAMPLLLNNLEFFGDQRKNDAARKAGFEKQRRTKEANHEKKSPIDAKRVDTSKHVVGRCRLTVPSPC